MLKMVVLLLLFAVAVHAQLAADCFTSAQRQHIWSTLKQTPVDRDGLQILLEKGHRP